MQKSLAIVIPAYKPDYLEKTLASLAGQSCRDYSLYIGDDASPHDLKSIVDRYRNSINLKYHRFDNNLGGSNLVAHWERCLALCEDQDWVCLFSDDDMMEPGCIEAFAGCEVPSNVDVLHFDIKLIDKEDRCLRDCPPFPETISSERFFDLLFRRQLVARMPEFIFRRSFLEDSGIVPFGLAWRSDTATVLNAGLSGGIKTITGDLCHVLWRVSGSNISGNVGLARQKNQSNIDFFNWLYEKNLQLPMSRFYLLKTIVFALEYTSDRHFFEDGILALRNLKYARWRRMLMLLLILYRIPYHWRELRHS